MGNSDQIEGTAKKATGKVKEGYGDLTDDTSTEFSGKADQVEGEVQAGFGDLREDVDDQFDSDSNTPS